MKRATPSPLVITDTLTRGPYLEAILGALSAHICVVNPEGEIITVNKAWEKFSDENTGLESSIGSNYLEVCRKAAGKGDPVAARALAGIESVLSGSSCCFDFEYPCHALHERRWFHMQVTPLEFPDAGRGAVIAHENITDRYLAAEQLKTHTRELERSNEALSHFSANVAHELREPLRKVQAFGSRLTGQDPVAMNGQFTDYLHRMVHATDRMKRLIDNLLVYSRLSHEGREIHTVNLNRVIKKVKTELASEIKKNHATIETEPLPRVSADSAHMRILFSQLLTNALTFRKAGQPPSIHIYPVHQEDPFRVRIAIADKGIGIDPGYAERIFDMFFTLEGKKYDGAGLGLAICKRIMDQHNGRIFVQSRPGEGSIFFMDLPAAAVLENQEPNLQE